MKEDIKPQYKIFYSWQSDDKAAGGIIEKSIEKAVKKLEAKGYAIKIEQGGGGLGFISIEDAVRMKIQASDIFVGDVTPVGKVKYKHKLLPNANVLYEMGVATEVMSADRIMAVAVEGKWRVEEMPFYFNHYGLYTINTLKADAIDKIISGH